MFKKKIKYDLYDRILQCRAHMCISTLQKFRDKSFPSLSCYRGICFTRDAVDGSMLILPLSSCSLNLRAILSKATCFPQAKSMKSRAIPMHNFLLRYFPAYRARMFPPVALLVICAHVLASVCLYIRASVSERNRASGNAEERKDEWAGENCRLNGVDDPCSVKRLPSALSWSE